MTCCLYVHTCCSCMPKQLSFMLLVQYNRPAAFHSWHLLFSKISHSWHNNYIILLERCNPLNCQHCKFCRSGMPDHSDNLVLDILTPKSWDLKKKKKKKVKSNTCLITNTVYYFYTELHKKKSHPLREAS